jgi:hypothetical protein
MTGKATCNKFCPVRKGGCDTRVRQTGRKEIVDVLLDILNLFSTIRGLDTLQAT